MGTKSVGIGTGANTRNYSTMAAYASYVNAQAFAAPEACEIWNDGGAVADTAAVVLSGWTGGSSTNTLTVRPATGQGFRSNANVLTNALCYNPANGAALTNHNTSGAQYAFGDNVIIDGLQLSTDIANVHVVTLGNSSVLRNSIVLNPVTPSAYCVATAGTNGVVENTVLHNRGGGGGIQLQHSGWAITSSLIIATGVTGAVGVRLGYGVYAPLMKNTAVFNFATDMQVTAASGSTNNATDKSVFVDASYAGAGQTSITASEWVSVVSGSEDFRLSSSSTKLKNNGATTGPAYGIGGTTRPQGSAYDIGPWELLAAVDTTAPVLTTPTAVKTGTSTASGTVTTDEGAGTLYRYASTNATETAATVIAANLTSAVIAAGVQNVSFSGLAPGGTYYPHYVQKDAAATPNTSNVANGASFTTDVTNAVPTFSGTIANITGTGGAAIAPADVRALFADTDALTYSASPAGTAWPSGLSVNSASGIISGTVATSTTTGLKVRATDTASQTVDSNAFSVTISAPASTVTGVTVSPASPSVTGGTTRQFTATVTGTGSPSQTVNWSVTGGGSINASTGVLTAPAPTSSVQTLTVTATSAQDGTKSGSTPVTVPTLASVTFTYAWAGKNINGGKRLGVAHKCIIRDKASGTLLGTKTGLTSDAATGLATFTLPVGGGIAAGVEYEGCVISDANVNDRGYFLVVPV